MARGPDPDVSAEEILRYMVQSPDPAFTANEIADRFEKTRQWADGRLKSMKDDDLVEVKRGGTRSQFWWVTKKGHELVFDAGENE